jgi:hypothetical protein
MSELCCRERHCQPDLVFLRHDTRPFVDTHVEDLANGISGSARRPRTGPAVWGRWPPFGMLTAPEVDRILFERTRCGSG